MPGVYKSKVTQEAQRAYQSLVENREPDMSQLLQVSNPLRMLRSGQLPLIKPRLRTSTLPTVGHAKHADRRSVPDSDCLEERSTALDLGSNSTNQESHFNNDINRNQGQSSFRTNGSTEKEDNPIPLPPRDRNKTLLTSKPRHTRKHPLIIPASATLQRTLDKVTLATPPPVSNSDPFLHANVQSVDVKDTDQNRERNYDTESLHFEEQIDSELAALDHISQDQDCVDGATDNLNNISAEQSSNKVQSHHVSCEDLLEFADAKPSSRARGNESDEVRIMSKVLGKDVSKEQCLSALEHCDWDVLKAIKLAKLQRLATGADLITCSNALDSSSWDVTRAAQWILSQDSDVLQV